MLVKDALTLKVTGDILVMTELIILSLGGKFKEAFFKERLHFHYSL